VYVTVRDLEKSFSFDKTVEFAGQVQFLIHMKTTAANTCYISDV